VLNKDGEHSASPNSMARLIGNLPMASALSPLHVKVPSMTPDLGPT